ncbi:expressed unknown protein [Seminavis robusta]|uniref:Uncharacterized protein n=1 Tax=Seminavis robusta TaxID=568900 RepID=A0A9N8E8S2_9STRA|nr:expressed unknown protein [Seminavis robusta]|eukprot:Sro673_g185210.1 n/a (94) ;mRNA; f:19046-19327
MLDGKEHSKKELVKLAGWANTDNKAFKKLMKCMKDMGLIEQGGTVQFADVLFPGGRPEEDTVANTSDASTSRKRKADDGELEEESNKKASVDN